MAGLGDFVRDVADEFARDVDRIHKRAFTQTLEQANTPGKVQGTIAVDTSNLRNSLSVNGSSEVSGWQTAVIAAPPLGELRAVWGAPYGIFVEEGANGVPPRLFAETAVQQWGNKVAQELARLR